MGVKPNKSTTHHVDMAHDILPLVPEGSSLPWYKQPKLRELYFMMVFLFLGSTTLGYDGSLLNGLQTMTTWQDCEQNRLSSTHR